MFQLLANFFFESGLAGLGPYLHFGYTLNTHFSLVSQALSSTSTYGRPPLDSTVSNFGVKFSRY